MEKKKEKPEGLLISDEKWEIIMSEVMDNKPILFSSKTRGMGMTYISREIAEQLNRPFAEFRLPHIDLFEFVEYEDSYVNKMLQTENAIITITDAKYQVIVEFIDMVINKKEVKSPYSDKILSVANGVTFIIQAPYDETLMYLFEKLDFLKDIQKIEFVLPDREEIEAFAKREYPNLNEKSVKNISNILEMINSMYEKTELKTTFRKVYPSISTFDMAFRMLEDGLPFDDVFYYTILMYIRDYNEYSR